MTVSELRESRGESRERFAFSVGVSARTIYRWEEAGYLIDHPSMKLAYRRKMARMTKGGN